MSKTLIIHGTEIKPGEEKWVNMNVAKLPSHTLIDIPVLVSRSKQNGPVLLLIAGLHGDEINSVEIIRRMILDKITRPLIGTVIAIPILNVYGFINYSRQVSDGKDVNRSFPGNPKGSLASRVAYLFMKEIFPHIDYGVDFHTGGGSRANYPQIRCWFSDKQSLAFAEAFQSPFIMNAALRDKSLRKQSHRHKKSIIVFEGGEALRLDEYAIKEAIDGTKRIMHHLRMRGSAPEPLKSSVLLPKTRWVRARQAGLFQAFVTLGSFVKKRQLLCSITDPYGHLSMNIKSSNNGYVIGLNNAAVVNQGDALLHIGSI